MGTTFDSEHEMMWDNMHLKANKIPLKWRIMKDDTMFTLYRSIKSLYTEFNLTWSRGISRLLLILFLRYWQRKGSNSFVLCCFQCWEIAHNSETKYPIIMGFAWNVAFLSYHKVVKNLKIENLDIDSFPLIVSRIGLQKCCWSMTHDLMNYAKCHMKMWLLTGGVAI